MLSADDPGMFSLIFDRYADGFIRRATYILGDRDEAKDAAQEAFIKLYGAANRYAPRRDVPFKSFAYRVLLNTCLSLIRKKAVRPAVLFDEAFAETVADDASAEIFEAYVARDWLSSLISRLPLVLRRTTKLVILGGKSTKEAAKEEGVSEVAIRVRLSRAAKEMRKLALSMERVSVE